MNRVNRTLTIAGMLMVCLSGAVLSEEIVVPVPGVVGYYDYFTPTRSGSFMVNVDATAIERVKLRLVGILPVPSFTNNCGYNGAIFSADLPAEVGSWIVSDFYTDRRQFDLIFDFEPVGDATWDFLLDGEGEIALTAISRPLPEGCNFTHGSWPTEPDITTVELTFVLRPTVPVDQATWGAIKALYGISSRPPN